jgi:phosphatidylinositol glycan class P protein
MATQRSPSRSLAHQAKSAPDLQTLRSLSADPLADPPADDGAHSSSSEGRGGVDGAALQRRLHQPHHARKGAPHHLLHPSSSSQLFPPFYNRPPTPLPPSPSLTSLLRPPPFSTQASRPTTPESSDVESATGAGGAGGAGSATAASVENSAAQAAASVPRATPKIPTYEYYGFALYFVSSAAFLVYLLWAYLPSPFLHQLGIHYYPNRWWALAVPAWLVVLLVYVYVALACYNTGYLTLPMQSIENLVDETGQIAVVDRRGRIIRPLKASRFRRPAVGKGGRRRRESEALKSPMGSFGRDPDLRGIWDEGTAAVMDIPVGAVCELLYGERRDSD